MKFRGYCCSFDTDLKKDIFTQGCFQYTLPIPIFYEHKSFIGYVNKIKENHNGLYIEFTIYNNMYNNKLYSYIRYNFFKGLLNYLSLGFTVKQCYYLNNIRYLINIEILEISIVKKPTQPNTKFYLR